MDIDGLAWVGHGREPLALVFQTMTIWLRILLLVVLLAGSGLWVRYRPKPACRLSFAFVLITAIAWAASVLTGLLRGTDRWVADGHRFSAHALIIAAWIAAAVSIGVLVGRSGRRGLWGVLARTMLVCAAVGSCILTAATGYLQSQIPGSEPDTDLRFRVLHEVGLPAVSFALFVVWLISLRRSCGGG